MLLKFHRFVEVQNKGLNYLYWTSLFAIIPFVIYRILWGHALSLNIPLTDDSLRVQVAVAPGSYSRGNLDKFWDSQRKSAICSDMARYNFWSGRPGDMHYENYTCISLCEKGSAADGCVEKRETFLDLGARENQVLLVTELEETFLQAASERKHFYIVPFTEELVVRLSYHCEVHGKKWLGARNVEWMRNSDYDLWTTIKDSEGNPWGEKVPLEKEIDLRVHDLLHLAGAPDLLDKSPQWAKANHHQDAAPGNLGPHARIAGLELKVLISCDKSEFGAEPSECALQVKLVEQASAREVTMETISEKGELLHRVYHGIRVKARGAGTFRYIYYDQMFVYLTSVIVLLGLPRLVLEFFACNCLGHLSKIYTEATVDPLQLADRISGMTMRMMEHYVSFKDLTYEIGGRNQYSISQQRMEGLLMETLHHKVSGSEIVPADIKRFVAFCFRNAANPSPPVTAFKLCWKLGEHILADCPETGGRLTDRGLDIDRYTQACTNNELFSLDTMINLFKQPYKPSFLERWFLPRSLYDVLLDADHHVEDSEFPKRMDSAENRTPEASDDLIANASKAYILEMSERKAPAVCAHQIGKTHEGEEQPLTQTEKLSDLVHQFGKFQSDVIQTSEDIHKRVLQLEKTLEAESVARKMLAIDHRDLQDSMRRVESEMHSLREDVLSAKSEDTDRARKLQDNMRNLGSELQKSRQDILAIKSQDANRSVDRSGLHAMEVRCNTLASIAGNIQDRMCALESEVRNSMDDIIASKAMDAYRSITRSRLEEVEVRCASFESIAQRTQDRLCTVECELRKSREDGSAVKPEAVSAVQVEDINSANQSMVDTLKARCAVLETVAASQLDSFETRLRASIGAAALSGSPLPETSEHPRSRIGPFQDEEPHLQDFQCHQEAPRESKGVGTEIAHWNRPALPKALHSHRHLQYEDSVLSHEAPVQHSTASGVNLDILMGPPTSLADEVARVQGIFSWVVYNDCGRLPFDKLIVHLDSLGVQLSAREQSVLKASLDRISSRSASVP